MLSAGCDALARGVVHRVSNGRRDCNADLPDAVCAQGCLRIGNVIEQDVDWGHIQVHRDG